MPSILFLKNLFKTSIMENTENKTTEEISNIEQFQVGRAPEEEKNIPKDDSQEESIEAGYTPEETEFADGQGTQLVNEISQDEETEPEQKTKDSFEDKDFGKDEITQPEVNDI